MEYIAFTSVKMRTMEGPAYLFLGYDAFSDKIIYNGVDPDGSGTTALKHVYYLMEIPEMEFAESPFWLVLDDFAEMDASFNKVMEGFGGKVLRHPAYCMQLMLPVLEHLQKSL